MDAVRDAPAGSRTAVSAGPCRLRHAHPSVGKPILGVAALDHGPRGLHQAPRSDDPEAWDTAHVPNSLALGADLVRGRVVVDSVLEHRNRCRLGTKDRFRLEAYSAIPQQGSPWV